MYLERAQCPVRESNVFAFQYDAWLWVGTSSCYVLGWTNLHSWLANPWLLMAVKWTAPGGPPSKSSASSLQWSHSSRGHGGMLLFYFITPKPRSEESNRLRLRVYTGLITPPPKEQPQVLNPHPPPSPRGDVVVLSMGRRCRIPGTRVPGGEGFLMGEAPLYHPCGYTAWLVLQGYLPHKKQRSLRTLQ
jgi:hypothetical protein